MYEQVDFLQITELQGATANDITNAIYANVVKVGLSPKMLIGHCVDNCNVMTGAKNGCKALMPLKFCNDKLISGDTCHRVSSASGDANKQKKNRHAGLTFH